MMKKFTYPRKIYFVDTDSAGVVYFSNLLSICHESYEEFLSSLDVNLKEFFNNQSLAIPVVHAEIDFFKPLFCGDLINIILEGKLVTNKVFEIHYEIFKQDDLVATALTRHISIDPLTRKTQEIPSFIKENIN